MHRGVNYVNGLYDKLDLEIQEVEIVNQDILSQEDILGIIGDQKGKSFFECDVYEIRDKLCKNPWVKDVVVQKIMPNKLLIDIEEEVADAVYINKNSAYLINKHGKFLHKIQREKIF